MIYHCSGYVTINEEEKKEAGSIEEAKAVFNLLIGERYGYTDIDEVNIEEI